MGLSNRIVLVALLLLGLTACSNPKRTAFETLESMRIQQCLNQPEQSPDCPTQRRRYDDYDATYRRQTRPD